MNTDLLRWAILAGGLVLALAIGPCLVWAPGGWAQRVRFLALLGYAVVTVGGQANALGSPPRWTTYLLAAVTVLALVGTLGQLRQEWSVLRGGKL